MGKKKNPNADLRLPDRVLGQTRLEHITFNDEHITNFRRVHIQQNGATEAEVAALVKGCEYSQPTQDRALLRDCALSKITCGEEGWRYHYEQCELRKHALYKKEKEQKNGSLKPDP